MPFRPSIPATLGLLSVAAACLALAGWQWQRAQDKAARQAQFAAAPAQRGLPPAADAGEFTRVTLAGHFDPERHLLADNQVLKGRAGVHAYTPFTSDTGTVILVNRGWLPLSPERSPLPAVPTRAEALEISGRLGTVQGPGRRLGEAPPPSGDQWPELVTYLNIDGAASALGVKLYPWILLLDADSPGGFDGRDWRPVFMTPQKHRAYAFQWLALAVLAVGCWGVAGHRRAGSAPA